MMRGAVICCQLKTVHPITISATYFDALALSNSDPRWDLMIAFPPCTHLAVSGARWFKDKQKEQIAAKHFFLNLAERDDVAKIAVENPIGVMSTYYRKPDQIIQPWMFGHPESKATCLWLKGLPKLVPTRDVQEGNAEAAQV